MEIREPARSDGQEPNPLVDDVEGDDALTLEFTLDDGGGGQAGTALHAALVEIAGRMPPMGDPMPGVLARARSIKRRRRGVRAVSTAAVLAVGVAVVPNAYDRLEDLRRPDQVMAGAPAAVVELPTAFPATEASPVEMSPESAVPTAPANFLGWPSRGGVVPSSVTDTAKGFLVDAAVKAGADPSVTVGVVRQLWAESISGGWLFVGEGWTSGSDGLSAAQLLVYRVYDKGGLTVVESPSVFPVRFTHPEPGSSADPAEVARIAEISILLPDTGQLLVIGAPQVATVYYAANGTNYLQEKTSAGVALFTRAKAATRGKSTDLVQVRDSKNRDLTPPVGWTVPDFVDTVTVYMSGGLTSAPTTMPSGSPSLLKPSQSATSTPSPAGTRSQ